MSLQGTANALRRLAVDLKNVKHDSTPADIATYLEAVCYVVADFAEAQEEEEK